MAATNGTAHYSVKGKTAIVTGAGSGINLEFASHLLARGCNVILADLKLRPEAQDVVDKHASSKPKAVFVKTDVTNWGDLSRTFDVAYKEFGNIDLVCPGAGIFEPDFSSFWYPPGVGSPSKDPVDGLGHYTSHDINITHPIRMTQLALSWFLNPPGNQPKASPQHPKRVVCIASIASELALLACPLYVSSKWAISGFVRCMDSLEASHGVRVNAIAPGLVKTPLWTEAPKKIAFIDENIDEWITTTEVAEAMLRLVEDPDLPGGTVLEIGAGNTRPIPLLENPGPQGPGHTLSNALVSVEQVHENLSKPGWGRVAK